MSQAKNPRSERPGLKSPRSVNPTSTTPIVVPIHSTSPLYQIVRAVVEDEQGTVWVGAGSGL
jgi:hypothetical protein